LTVAGPFFLGLDVLTYGASWSDALSTVELADRLGYDAIFTADHLFATGGDPFQPFFEGWTTLAAWSQRTRWAHLGLLVGANTFRNPGVVAKMATTLDHASGGRAILGLGAGWEVEEQLAHGIDPGASLGERLDWLDEALVLIRGILHGDSETFEEGHYRFRGVRQAPRPIQARVPVIVGASGPKKGLRIVARHADLWQFWSAIDGVAAFRDLDNVLISHCESIGRDPSTIRRLAGAKVVIRPTRDAADREFERQLAVQPWSGDILEYIATTGLWRTNADEAADAIAALVDAGVSGFIAQVYPPYDIETIEALAAEIAPRLGWQPRGGPAT
jgi:alkanesulfonate monooxygenase SsuD/methylene tetrahydromethanopterin reductase-like flavin-dependent oxidoreductase (luciferase family)